MPAGIFISYRRRDAIKDARSMYERLGREFGAESVFMDVEGLQYGDDFVQALALHLERCKVVLALIGPQWLTAADRQGRRRLDDPGDFVRIELASALARNGVRVVPVLLDGAELPQESDLPEDLRPLVRRQALELRDTSFDADMRHLSASLRRMMEVPPAPPETAVQRRTRRPERPGLESSPAVKPGPPLSPPKQTVLRERGGAASAAVPPAAASGSRGIRLTGFSLSLGLLLVFAALTWWYKRDPRPAAQPTASTAAPVSASAAGLTRAPLTPASASTASHPSANQCFRTTEFASTLLGQVAAVLRELAIPDADYRVGWSEPDEQSILYIGRIASQDALAQKEEELRRLKVSFTRVDPSNAELYPGLSLGEYRTRVEAERALAAMPISGVRTARVVTKTLSTMHTYLTLTAPEARAGLLQRHPSFVKLGITLKRCS